MPLKIFCGSQGFSNLRFLYAEKRVILKRPYNRNDNALDQRTSAISIEKQTPGTNSSASSGSGTLSRPRNAPRIHRRMKLSERFGRQVRLGRREETPPNYPQGPVAQRECQVHIDPLGHSAWRPRAASSCYNLPNGANESALFLKRSLMERLYKAGYTLITLTTDYKSHPQILDQYNCQVYNKQLQATPLTWH